MIEIVEGKGVGAGKSYTALERCIGQWSLGGTCFVSESFRVKWPETKAYVERKWGWLLEDDQFQEVAADKIQRFHEYTSGGTPDNPVLIVIDEAQDQLDVRDYANTEKKDLFSWCCQSRHDDNDLLFVTQSAKNIDARVRRLATFTWSIRNSKFFTIQGLGNLAATIKFFTLGLNDGFYFIRTQMDHDGKTPIDHKWVKADRGLFKCYESKSMRQSRKRLGMPIARKQLARKKGTHPMYKWILLGLIAAGIWTAVEVKQMFFPGKTAEVPAAAKAPAQISASMPASASGSAGSASSSTRAAAYDIRHERWLALGNGYVKTPTGTYQAGEMTADGLCEQVRGQVARVRRPDGRLLYIVGDDYTVVPPPSVQSTPSTAQKIVVAPWVPPAGITK